MRAALFAGLILISAVPAAADHGPVIAVPGRAGVPVMINGVDASYAYVEGDWGLGKSMHPTPVVTPPYGYSYWRAPARYFPRSNQRPGYGRLEIRPPAGRARVRPAESYYREWNASSADVMTPTAPVPRQPPTVITAPRSLQDQ